MSVTLGIYNVILIFFFIIVPGYLLRRFYYQSEFSKQLYSYTGQVTNLTYSFVVGLLFTLIYVFFINTIEPETIDVEKILVKFDHNFITGEAENINGNYEIKNDIDENIISEVKKQQNKFTNLYTKLYSTYLPYLASIYLLAIFCGYIFFKIVIYFNWDATTSLLRFKNTWHYLFTGRVLKNFKFKNSIPEQLKVKYTYLDVLVDSQADEPQLYSGLYVDYNLNTKDPTKLEKLHLLRPIRYDKLKKKTVLKEIPGKVFTIMGENILNINYTYIFEEIEEKKHRIFIRKRSLLAFGQFFTISSFVITSIILIFEINIFDTKFIEKSFEYNFFHKIALLLMLNILLGVVTPFNIDKKKEEIKFIGSKALLLKFIVFTILFIIIYNKWFFSLLSGLF